MESRFLVQERTHYLCAMKILMVCLGNICRSPLAEGILQHKAVHAGLDWTVESAGTNGFHTGEAPHHLSQKVAKQNGIDISAQVSRQFVADDLEKYDLIYAMATDVMDDIRRIAGNRMNESKVKYFRHELESGVNDVPDPWYGDEDGYTEVYDLIDRTSDMIVQRYSAINKSTPADV